MLLKVLLSLPTGRRQRLPPQRPRRTASSSESTHAASASEARGHHTPRPAITEGPTQIVRRGILRRVTSGRTTSMGRSTSRSTWWPRKQSSKGRGSPTAEDRTSRNRGAGTATTLRLHCPQRPRSPQAGVQFDRRHRATAHQLGAFDTLDLRNLCRPGKNLAFNGRV